MRQVRRTAGTAVGGRECMAHARGQRRDARRQFGRNLPPCMPGRMMDFPLTLTHLLERARRSSRAARSSAAGPTARSHRHTWAQVYARAAQLAHALARLGVKPGDRVATLAWNHHRHLEAYFAVADDGRRPAHAQPAPAPDRDRLHRAPRRGLGRHRRPLAPAALRAVRARACRRHAPRRRACPTPGPTPAGQARLRGAPRAPSRPTFDWPRARRERRRA